jgi:hypothetical protein
VPALFGTLIVACRSPPSQEANWVRALPESPAAALNATSFARALVAHGITADFDRQLFFGVYSRPLSSLCYSSGGAKSLKTSQSDELQDTCN